MGLRYFRHTLRARKGPRPGHGTGGVDDALRGNGMPHVWNEQYRALYDRTYRVLFDAGFDEKLANEWQLSAR